MATPRIAAETFLLGLHGEIHPGDEVPETYETTARPGEQKTDFERLDALGALHPDGYVPGEDAEGDAAADPYAGLKKADLAKLAEERGIELPKRAKADEILALLIAADEATEEPEEETGPDA